MIFHKMEIVGQNLFVYHDGNINTNALQFIDDYKTLWKSCQIVQKMNINKFRVISKMFTKKSYGRMVAPHILTF